MPNGRHLFDMWYPTFFPIMVDGAIQKLDMLTAHRRLKSPQSLYGTFTYPSMDTHRSQSWSWMIDSQPFLSVSISVPTPIPEIRLFQTLTFKLQGQGHGWGQMSRSHSSPSQHPTNAPPFRFTSIGPIIPEICPKECWTLEKHIQNFRRKFAKNRVSNSIPPKSTQGMAMTREI